MDHIALARLNHSTCESININKGSAAFIHRDVFRRRLFISRNNHALLMRMPGKNKYRVGVIKKPKALVQLMFGKPPELSKKKFHGDK
jgi:hypothetical protein